MSMLNARASPVDVDPLPVAVGFGGEAGQRRMLGIIPETKERRAVGVHEVVPEDGDGGNPGIGGIEIGVLWQEENFAAGGEPSFGFRPGTGDEDSPGTERRNSRGRARSSSRS